MDLQLNEQLATGITSPSQQARVIAEGWTASNMFCPMCGHDHLQQCDANQSDADYTCPSCNSNYELRIRNGKLIGSIVGSGYDTMIERISGNSNLHLLYMGYSKSKMKVENLMLVPKYFFLPEIIERRNPVKDSSKRAGFVGCNILIDRVPEQGKIHIIDNGELVPRDVVLQYTKNTKMLEIDNIVFREWMLDILMCINKVDKEKFSINDLYVFEYELSRKHPGPNVVRPKIRQYLQLLVDAGQLYSYNNGLYKRVGF